MKLFYALASPFVRKTLMVLHETGQMNDVELVDAAGTAVETGTLPLAQNPLGKIPTLQRADGQNIFDSRVICRFLNDRASANLYPQDVTQWDILTLEAIADGIMDASILVVYEARIRPAELNFAPWVDAQWGKAARAIATLNADWIDTLHGPQTIGQIAVSAALGYCDFRLSDRDWRSDNPALAAWYAAYSERPSFQATRPDA